ncbi:hypothetical protein C6501_05020 [Candidatus Poribacteria bacterium]|nr:MAG: hypothetical protein C6501_05020 [Candidatus Poribacteria bacterium]
MAKKISRHKSEKTEKFYRIAKHFGAFVLLILILIVGGRIRLQGLANIPTGQFASNDAFLYLAQAETIIKDGALPKVEMHRWVPLGRDLRETLSGYPYAIAYAYKVTKLFLPNVTIYQVLLYAPTICFLIGMAVLCLFLYIRFGFGVAAIAGTLLVIMPGSIERSAAGFSDRDGWCWMLGTLTVTTYLWKENITSKWTRYLCTVLSGFFVFLGGLSWEGFGGFVLAIVAVELWRFLTTDAEERLWEYVLWVLMFVPSLYLLSPAYHSGSGFASHVAAFLLFPSLVMLLLRALRYFLTRGHHSVSKFVTEQISARAISLVFCAVCLLIGIAYLALQRETFVQSIVPFSGADVMKDVGELKSPHDIFWYGRYGHVLLIASLCIIVGCVRIWGTKALILAFVLSLFTAATFLRQYLYWTLSPVICEYLFYGAVAFTPIAALGVAALRPEPVKHEYIYVAFAFWLLLWLGLARDALRYDFFIGVPLACFAAIGVQFVTTRFCQHIARIREEKSMAENTAQSSNKEARTNGKQRNVVPALTQVGFTLACLALILFLELPSNKPFPGLVQRGYAMQIAPEHAYPGKNTPMANAFQWISEHVSTDKVVAAPWSYGHMLNVLGGVKTIIGPDHFILHWIDLYEEHVAAATYEQEALEFLKTHHATHLLLSEEEVFHIASQHTHVDEQPEHPLYMVPLVPRAPIGSAHYRMVPAHKNTLINFVEIDFHHNPATVTARLKNGRTVKLPYIKSDGSVQPSWTEHAHDHHTEESNDENGGILHLFDSKTQREVVHYLSPHSWNSLAVKLFFRDEHSEAFVHAYPEQETASAKVKIWKINYPGNIEENPKYLAKSPKGKEKAK